MKAKPLPRTKHHALKRITEHKKARDWRAFKRDMAGFAIITACFITAAAAALVILCIVLEMPL